MSAKVIHHPSPYIQITEKQSTTSPSVFMKAASQASSAKQQQQQEKTGDTSASHRQHDSTAHSDMDTSTPVSSAQPAGSVPDSTQTLLYHPSAASASASASASATASAAAAFPYGRYSGLPMSFPYGVGTMPPAPNAAAHPMQASQMRPMQMQQMQQMQMQQMQQMQMQQMQQMQHMQHMQHMQMEGATSFMGAPMGHMGFFPPHPGSFGMYPAFSGYTPSGPSMMPYFRGDPMYPMMPPVPLPPSQSSQQALQTQQVVNVGGSGAQPRTASSNPQGATLNSPAESNRGLAPAYQMMPPQPLKKSMTVAEKAEMRLRRNQAPKFQEPWFQLHREGALILAKVVAVAQSSAHNDREPVTATSQGAKRSANITFAPAIPVATESSMKSIIFHSAHPASSVGIASAVVGTGGSVGFIGHTTGPGKMYSIEPEPETTGGRGAAANGAVEGDGSSSSASSADDDSSANSDNEGDDDDDDDEASHKHKKLKRGNLPKQATSHLKNWLFAHVTRPYPSDEEKRELSKATRLSVNQINNWFINARRRILQPMMDRSKDSPALAAAAAAIASGTPMYPIYSKLNGGASGSGASTSYSFSASQIVRPEKPGISSKKKTLQSRAPLRVVSGASLSVSHESMPVPVVQQIDAARLESSSSSSGGGGGGGGGPQELSKRLAERIRGRAGGPSDGAPEEAQARARKGSADAVDGRELMQTSAGMHALMEAAVAVDRRPTEQDVESEADS